MEIITVTTVCQLEQCLKIRRDVFVGEQGVPESLEVDGFDRSPAECRHILLTLQGEPAATGRLTPYDETTIKVQRVAVCKGFRTGGLGRAIMKALEEEALRLGYRRCLLNAQIQAQGFYEKLGYTALSPEPFLEAGIWHVRMEKSIR
ncbi:GNAT family N-acetyltransferase [Heliomicrobium gestii]|uniref:GNAT family N-acetyltransferase n=1 Tax=Heliomicrobium gestii TaxID=2699 RepID=UPI002E29211F|nr:GNAT family N-acetyltransferase [Heliomicrobium gestii]MBM7867301.1 putative GNAT family N-acyltransferase [Heliomicrobium gestii]